MFNIKKKKKKFLFISMRDCIGCGDCFESCKRGVIGMFYNERYSYATIEHIDKCTGCGRCVKACRVSAIELISK